MTIKKLAMMLGIVLLTVVVAGCSNNEDNQNADGTGEGQKETADNEDNNSNKTVAKVNDSEIKRGELDLLVNQMTGLYEQIGQTISDEQLAQLEQQSLNQLISTELILQDAKDKGYEATSEAIDEELSKLKEQQFENDEEQFQQALEQSGLTEEDLRQDIAEQIVMTEYEENELDIPEVTDEEAREAYDQQYASAEGGENQEEPPAFEDVKSRLKEDLKTQKVNKALQQIAEDLREEADVEILI